MINNTEHVLIPEDILEIDILPNLPNSAGYQNIVTMIDVFSRYLFAYPPQNVTAKTIVGCIIDVMTRHAYLLTLFLSDKSSQFRSEVVAEITQIIEIQISHESTKHAQTIGILEKTHASIKTALKISTSERRSMWHQNVQIAVMNYNTTYHETLVLRLLFGVVLELVAVCVLTGVDVLATEMFSWSESESCKFKLTERFLLVGAINLSISF